MSESTRHTLGPWTFDGRFCTNDGAVAVTAPHPELGKTRIALVDIQCKAKRGHGWETPCPERDANAKLIAASPELLTFAEEMAGEMNCVCKGKMGEIQKAMGTNVACRKCQADAAIKKARGSDV